MVEIAYVVTTVAMSLYASYWQSEAIRARNEAARMEHYKRIAQAKKIEVVADPNMPKDRIYLLLGMDDNG